jgi:trans-2,3-dihydro-3-hydroxyanthranilate isomerase
MHDYQVLDVFTDTPLQGNPLAVFLDATDLDTETMQRTARELNLSETVFLLAGEDGSDARLRIFTPAAELPFAGHPTLGAAFVVAARDGRDALRLTTGAGEVPVTLTREGNDITYGEMDQPLPAVESFDGGDELLGALGVHEATLPIGAYSNGPLHVYVGLADLDAVAALAPDLGAVAQLVRGGVNCFARGDGHVETRNFSPGLGVPEDPATGSAAGPLAYHMVRHGVIGYGEEIEIHQGTVMGRPSVLRARVEGSAQRLDRVVVGGSAVVVAEGRYRLS